jgi:hypothetical protein
METIRSSETSIDTGLYNVISQKPVMFMVTAVRTGNTATDKEEAVFHCVKQSYAGSINRPLGPVGL